MQCPKCGNTSNNNIKCNHCNFVFDEKKQKASYKVNSAQEDIHELEPTPRSVPLFFILRSLSVHKMIVAGYVYAWALLIIEYKPHALGIEPQLAAYTINGVFVGFLLMLAAVGWKKISLLRSGNIAKPELLERIPWRNAYGTAPTSAGQSTSAAVYNGWKKEHVPVGSARFRHIMKLTGNNQKSHSFCWKNYKYIGEYFLFDPDNPRKWLRQGSFGMSLIPKYGKWHSWPRDKQIFAWFVLAPPVVLSFIYLITWIELTGWLMQ